MKDIDCSTWAARTAKRVGNLSRFVSGTWTAVVILCWLILAIALISVAAKEIASWP